MCFVQKRKNHITSPQTTMHFNGGQIAEDLIPGTGLITGPERAIYDVKSGPMQ